MIAVVLCFTILMSVSASTLEVNNMIHREEYTGIDASIEESICSDVYSSIDNNGVLLRSYPTSYDPRNTGLLTDIKHQYKELCWDYASTATVEQCLSYQYGTKFDVSESHLFYASSECIKPDSYTNNLGFSNITLRSGATMATAYQYYTNWNYPIDYNELSNWNSSVSGSSFPKSKLMNLHKVNEDTDFGTAVSMFNVSSVKKLSYDILTFKSAISQYGAITTSIKYNSDYFSALGEEVSYFIGSNNSRKRHAITIIGWNDQYSKDNFAETNRPNNNGAWLVRDSNNSVCHNGYYWVSYEESSLINSYVVTGFQKASNNEHMLSYNYLYTVNSTDLFTDTLYLCSIFDLSDFVDEYDQISKVMLYLSVDGICDYEIKIIPVDNFGSLTVDPDSYSNYASGQYSGEGYITVDFNNAYIINAAEKCAVIVKITPENGSSYYIPYSVCHQNSQPNKCYVGKKQSNTMTWDNCYSMNTNSYHFSGALVIKPVLSKSNIIEEPITITPSVVNGSESTQINISSMDLFFNAHTIDGTVLRQDIDYEKNNNGILINQNYLEALNENYTEIILEFNNDTTKTLIINPKSTITNVNVSGATIVGDTLSAVCEGTPERSRYDLDYCWQRSEDGVVWQNITNSNSDQYTVNANDFGMYMRVEVTPQTNGNVLSGGISNSTLTKCVILCDVNMDGQITTDDVNMICYYLAEYYILNPNQMLAADVNRDGRVSITDATIIQTLLSGA